MKIDEIFKAHLKAFLEYKEVKEAIKEERWQDLIDLVQINLSEALNGAFMDLLLSAGIDICPYLYELTPNLFYNSKLIEIADLKTAHFIDGICFKFSNIKTINLYKNSLEGLGVEIISGVEHPVTINWDGTYKEWERIRQGTHCWDGFFNIVTIHCVDGVYEEN